MSDTRFNKFRVRGPSYQRWTDTETLDITKAWEDTLNGIMGLNKLKPEDIAGFRVQINFKKEAKPEKVKP